MPKLKIIKFSDYKNANEEIKNKIMINSNKKYLKNIKEKIEFYEELKLENNWQEINLKIRKMELMRKINNEDKHENLIKEIRECYENIDKQEKFTLQFGIKEAKIFMHNLKIFINRIYKYICIKYKYNVITAIFKNKNDKEILNFYNYLINKYENNKKWKTFETGGKTWLEILKKEGKRLAENKIILEKLKNSIPFEELKHRLITTFQLRGILEIYKALSLKFNFYHKILENKLKEIINNLEDFEEIFEDLNENFGINTKIMNFLKINGKDLINDLINDQIKIEVIKVY
uniref:Uncharacterized protein n=1 Tax=Meloidogyne enterolobii TaxID=390850 RepID=A0A6V7V084_MELEN|nr:unnamed protein product [Meloidogyne enterolobii]